VEPLNQTARVGIAVHDEARAPHGEITQSTSGRHTVPAEQAVQLVRLVRRWNVPADTLLSDEGLSEEDLEAREARLPIETMNGLVARARALTSEPGLGFYMGFQKRASTYGFLGLAVDNARSLGEAITLSTRFVSTVTTALGLRLHVEQGLAALIVDEHVDLGVVRDIALLSLLIGMDRIGFAITGRELHGAIDVTIPEPSYFHRFAHSSPVIRFNQPVTQVVFDAAALELPVAAADPGWQRLAIQQCERELDQLGFADTLDARVRRLLWTDEGFRSRDAVAAALCMSPRTLNRKLADYGCSFSSLVDRERCERSLLLLRSANLSVDDVADRLGYSSTPNFGRAFHRWTGKTPAAYRRGRERPSSRVVVSERG
jgi:AraC-like DNA-binding protein